MDDVTLEKLENIKNCLARVEQKTPFTIDQITQDLDLQDIITVNIQRAIQASVDLANHIGVERNSRTPQDMADSFTVLRELGIIDSELEVNLRKSVGLRNVLVHDYSGIDWHIIHKVAHEYLSIFKELIRVILFQF